MEIKPNLVFENRDAQDFLKEIDDNSIDLVLTDPPYQISKKTGFQAMGDKGVERLRISMDFGKWDKIAAEDHASLFDNVFGECYRVLRKGGTIIVFYDLWKLESLACLLKSKKFKMLRFIEWIKTIPVPINSKVSYLTNAREVAIVATKGSKPTFHAKYHNGVFSQPIHRDGGKRLHPTQKPLKLMHELIDIHSNAGDVVLDPFCGSATMLVAAIQQGRNAMGCELDKQYYDKAVERLKDVRRHAEMDDVKEKEEGLM